EPGPGGPGPPPGPRPGGPRRRAGGRHGLRGYPERLAIRRGGAALRLGDVLRRPRDIAAAARAGAAPLAAVGTVRAGCRRGWRVQRAGALPAHRACAVRSHALVASSQGFGGPTAGDGARIL